MNFRYSILAFGLLLSSGIRCSEDADFLEQLKPIPFTFISQSNFSEDEFYPDFIGIEKDEVNNDDMVISENIDQNVSSEVNDIIFMLNNLEKFSQLPGKLPNSLILHGPSGTGKTTLAQIIAHKTGRKFIKISAPQMVQKFQGATQHAIKDLFVSAKASKRPCVLFLDELDGLVNDKAVDSNGTFSQAAQAIQTELDDCNSHVFFITATNFPERIPHALENRMGESIEIKLPNAAKRKTLLKSLYKDLFSDSDLEKFSKITHGLNCRELERIVNKSATEAVKHNDGTITADHFYTAFYTTNRKPLSQDQRLKALLHYLKNETVAAAPAHIRIISTQTEGLTGLELHEIVEKTKKLQRTAQRNAITEQDLYVATYSYVTSKKNQIVSLTNDAIRMLVIDFYFTKLKVIGSPYLKQTLLQATKNNTYKELKAIFKRAQQYADQDTKPIGDLEIKLALFKDMQTTTLSTAQDLYTYHLAKIQSALNIEFLAKLALATRSFTGNNIESTILRAEQYSLQRDFEEVTVTEEDVLVSSFQEISQLKQEMPQYTYRDTQPELFALEMRKAVLKNHAQKHNLGLSENTSKLIAQETGVMSAEQFEAIVQALIHKTIDRNSNTIEYQDFEQGVYQLAVVPSKRFILTQSELNAAQHFDNCFKLNVLSQNHRDGGGRLSCGYHALKNGLIITQAIQALPHERSAILRKLNAASFITDRFGSINAHWRKAVVLERKKTLMRDFIHDILLSTINGVKTSRMSRSANNTNVKKYYFKNEYVTFAAYPQGSIATIEERNLLLGLLIEVAKETISNVPLQVEETEPITITGNAIKTALQEILRKKAIQNARYAQLNTDAKILLYFPEILSLEAIMTDTLFQETYTSQSLSTDQINKRIIGCSEGLSTVPGEWLSLEDIQLISNTENVLVDSVTRNLMHTDILILDNFEEYLRTSTANPIQNDQLLLLKQSIAEANTTFTKILILLKDSHWTTCVINKQGREVQFMFADSFDNRWNIANDYTHDLVQFLTDKSIAAPADMQIPAIDTNDISTKSHLSSIPSVDLPTLDMIFNDKLPDGVRDALEGLKDTNTWLSTESSLPKFLLFHGPAGTGKTTAAEIIARKTDRQLIFVSGGDFVRRYQGEASERLGRLFNIEAKRYNKPVIILFDEVDQLARSVQENDNHDVSGTRATFINYLEACAKDPNIFIIATTNNENLLDAAIKSRFESIKLDLPDYKMRKKIIKYYFDRNDIEIVNEPNKNHNNVYVALYFYLTVLTDGFSQRDINTWINKACRNMRKKRPTNHTALKRMDDLCATNFQKQELVNTVLSNTILLWLVPIKICGGGTTLHTLAEKHLYESFLGQRDQIAAHGSGYRTDVIMGACIGAIAVGGIIGVGAYLAASAGAITTTSGVIAKASTATLLKGAIGKGIVYGAPLGATLGSQYSQLKNK